MPAQAVWRFLLFDEHGLYFAELMAQQGRPGWHQVWVETPVARARFSLQLGEAAADTGDVWIIGVPQRVLDGYMDRLRHGHDQDRLIMDGVPAWRHAVARFMMAAADPAADIDMLVRATHRMAFHRADLDRYLDELRRQLNLWQPRALRPAHVFVPEPARVGVRVNLMLIDLVLDYLGPLEWPGPYRAQGDGTLDRRWHRAGSDLTAWFHHLLRPWLGVPGTGVVARAPLAAAAPGATLTAFGVASAAAGLAPAPVSALVLPVRVSSVPLPPAIWSDGRAEAPSVPTLSQTGVPPVPRAALAQPELLPAASRMLRTAPLQAAAASVPAAASSAGPSSARAWAPGLHNQSYRDVQQTLQAIGWHLAAGQRGGHPTYLHPARPGVFIEVPRHGGRRTLPPGTVRDIYRRAGLAPPR